ncbi:hypothetical protein DPMN_066634 [Dreissena polymorpha]|uniref:Uncharacterized protein n=1 Tax=Dreissena polymorpha TaxID=45954 RepID=A0A9D3YTV4_DREPO|nr:hypothetical protein DPMN_066634 [Dreissena polymorpha]
MSIIVKTQMPFATPAHQSPRVPPAARAQTASTTHVDAKPAAVHAWRVSEISIIL